MRKFVVPALLASAVFAMSAPAQAATFVQLNNGPVNNKVKAFSDGTHPSTGQSVYGKTTVEDELVKFTGDTTLHVTDGSGFAQISDNNADDGAWKSLTIAFDNYAFGFTGLEFSLQFDGAGTLGVKAIFFDDTFETFSYSNQANSNTQFYLAGGTGQVFKSVVLTSNPGPFFQFKQAEIGLIAAPPPAVPEPATWAMMLGGLGLAGAALRRRTTKVQFA